MTNPIIYVVINNELKMSPGKAAAQAVHASMMLQADSKEQFMKETKRTVIVLEAKNSQQIMNLYAYLDGTRIDHDYYIDEGMNEVDAFSITALAAGPIAFDDDESREIFSSFKLYGGHITVKRVDNTFGFFGKETDRTIVANNTAIESRIAMRALKKGAVDDRFFR